MCAARLFQRSVSGRCQVASEVNTIMPLASAISPADTSRNVCRNNRRFTPISRCTAHIKHIRDCRIKNTKKRHGSLTTIIDGANVVRIVNVERLHGHVIRGSFATSKQLVFLHPPALNTALTPIGNSPAALINSQEYQITLLTRVPVTGIKSPYHTPALAWAVPSPPPVISFTLRVINQ